MSRLINKTVRLENMGANVVSFALLGNLIALFILSWMGSNELLSNYLLVNPSELAWQGKLMFYSISVCIPLFIIMICGWFILLINNITFSRRNNNGDTQW